MSEAIEIRCGRRIRKIDLLRNPGVDITSRMTDEMVSSVAQDAIEQIKRESNKFVRILDAVPFRDDEIMVEVAAAIIPIGELAYLESREREYERERQRARDLTAKLKILAAELFDLAIAAMVAAVTFSLALKARKTDRNKETGDKQSERECGKERQKSLNKTHFLVTPLINNFQ